MQGDVPSLNHSDRLKLSFDSAVPCRQMGMKTTGGPATAKKESDFNAFLEAGCGFAVCDGWMLYDWKYRLDRIEAPPYLKQPVQWNVVPWKMMISIDFRVFKLLFRFQGE